MKFGMKRHHFYFLSFAIFALSLGFISSCSKGVSNEIESPSNVLSAAAVINSSATPQDKAEKLALIADQLFASGALAQALDVTDVALTLDETNLRAGLISALAKPMVTLRGVGVRAAPLAYSHPGGVVQDAYHSFLGADGSYSSSRPTASAGGFETWLTATDLIDPVKIRTKFYYSAAPSTFIRREISDEVEKLDKKLPGFAIRTEAQLQIILDKAITEFDQLRNFVSARKNESLVVTATAIMIPDLIQRYASRCVVKESDKLVYELTCPPDEERNHIRLNRADFELIGDIAAYYEASMILATSYDVPGLAALDLAASADARASMLSFLQDKRVGKLRSQQRLSSLTPMSLDLANALSWASANQSTLCGLGKQDPNNRPGFVFNQGFCLGGDFSLIINTLAAVSRGETVDDPTGPYDSAMKPSAFFAQPIQDLQSLNPKFNNSGALISVEDQTFGGAFPKNDFNKVLQILNASQPQ